MIFTKIVLIIILLYTLSTFNEHREKFSDAEIKNKASNIYKNKSLFKPGAKYTDINKKLGIDVVLYDDIYNLSLTENLTISNLEKTLYDSIK